MSASRPSPVRYLDAARVRLRSALWPIPALAVCLAVALGVVMPAVDQLLDSSGAEHPLTFVFGGGAAAARDLLAAIAGSLISVTGLTFSLTVVALQLGSSQYSPRLLQTFATDRVVQLTLAQLSATFVYALTVLRTVRTESATRSDTAFVPRLSITVAYVLTLGSVLALLLFLGHLARQLRVETMLRDVHVEATATMARTLIDRDEDEAPAPASPRGRGRPILASSSGFLVGVDDTALVAGAREARAVVRLLPRIGDPVLTGIPLAHAWPDGSGEAPDLDRLRQSLAVALRVGFERVPDSDLTYSLRKVVDIAVRALSPGINDPTTAVHAISHASAVVGDLLQHRLQPVALRDDHDVVRVVRPQWSHDAVLELALEEPLQMASGQPAVLRRLAAFLREAAWRAPSGLHDSLLRTRMTEVVELAADTTRVSATELAAWQQALDQALAGQWPTESDRNRGRHVGPAEQRPASAPDQES